MKKTTKKKKTPRTQYKVWVHIEIWKDGEPRDDGDFDMPTSVNTGTGGNLLNSLRKAKEVKNLACNR